MNQRSQKKLKDSVDFWHMIIPIIPYSSSLWWKTNVTSESTRRPTAPLQNPRQISPCRSVRLEILPRENFWQQIEDINSPACVVFYVKQKWWRIYFIWWNCKWPIIIQHLDFKGTPLRTSAVWQMHLHNHLIIAKVCAPVKLLKSWCLDFIGIGLSN